jgi:uncharacterized protein (TIGR04222 family)
MNIFDLRGPAFLALYLFASLAGLIALHVVSRRGPPHGPRLPAGEALRQLRDPYLLAYLRGGVAQALQTVAFSLSERKLLSVSKKGLVASAERSALQSVTHPLEIAVLEQCASLRGIGKLLGDRKLRALTEGYAAPLEESGLLADDAEYARRLPAFLAVAGTLLALSVIKIYVALQGGHRNIGFLVLFTVIALIVAVVIFRRRRTKEGDQALADQQTLFGHLKGRARKLAAGGATGEAVLIAAAFGLAALPAAAYPFAETVRRQAQNGGGGGCGGGGGGGGGCGGGGCGGCGGGG